MKILVANIVSTSFKYRLFDMTDESLLTEGKVERIGQPVSEGGCPDYATAIDSCVSSLIGTGKPLKTLSELAAAGFKVVHAKGLSGTVIVDEQVLQAVEAYNFLLPAHNPPYAAAMRAFKKTVPQVPVVALFETAFFQEMDQAATTYAVPYEWTEKFHVRRFGYHGASHRWASERVMSLYPGKNLRHVSCHLGGSSSLAAIKNGKAVDTSFGMTPQCGIPQNNRVGDMDIFAVLYMMQEKGLSVSQTASLLSKESGMAGISGVGGDMRDIEQASSAGNQRAKLALDVFIYAVRRYLGSFMLELGGVDVITFSGGIGEKGPETRRQILRNMESFGVKLDQTKNNTKQESLISTPDSQVKVWVINTNEELIVARASAAIIK